MVFIATDAGGVGLNLQNCDFMINMELPWNPAKLNQRIGRIHRIGQKSNKIHVVDMVMTGTIEEKIATGLGLKQDLFDAVFSGNASEVDFNRDGRSQFLNQINAMLAAMQKPLQNVPVETNKKPELDLDDPHYLNPQLLGDVEQRDEGYAPVVQENPNLEASIPHTSEESFATAESVGSVESPQSPVEVGFGEVDLNEEYQKDDLASGGGVANPNMRASGNSDSLSGMAERPTNEDPGNPTGQREQLQEVLSQGLMFLNTLARMSTGKSLFVPGASNPIEIDPDTGEVFMRFKLG